jgi:formylglycine-generating enzyme required for sulfatase activity
MKIRSRTPRPQFACDDGQRFAAPARFGRSNAFGLYGMLGNVGEWTADCGLADYATTPRDGSASATGDCSTHVGRGGSWWNDAYYIRAARGFSMAGGYDIVGFRVARELRAPGSASRPSP